MIRGQKKILACRRTLERARIADARLAPKACGVVGEPIVFTALLEIVTAMQLKVFRGEARPYPR